MGVMKYMQDGGPSFMSYRRKPTLNLSAPPERAVKKAPAYAGTDFDYDLKANEGDKQLLYDRHTQQQSAVRGIFDKYGGESAWMQSDPDYKKAMALGRWDVYDRQAAEFNYDMGVERNKQLVTQGSGQNPSDFELQRQGNVYLPEVGEKGLLNKSEYLTHTRRNPQTYTREDGTEGILETQYDRNSGDMENVHGTWDKLLSGGNIGHNARGHDESVRNKIGYTGQMTHSIDVLRSSGYDSDSNWDQIDDAIAFVKKYGFDDQTEYGLWQSMYDDIEEGRPIKTPVRDEDGKVVTNDEGQVQWGEAEVSPQVIAAARAGDPKALKEVEEIYDEYVTQKFIDYSEKFREKSYKDRVDNADINTGYDPQTGAAVEEEPPVRYWEQVAKNDVFTGQTKAGATYVPDGNGGFKLVETGSRVNEETGQREMYANMRYEDEASIGLFLDQANAGWVGETIGELTSNADWQTENKDKMMIVGNTWQKMPAGIENAQIDEVVGYEEMIAPNGEVIHVAVTKVLVDDDADYWRDLRRYDPATKKSVPFVEDGYVTDNNIVFGTSKSDVRATGLSNYTDEQKQRINQVSGASYGDDGVMEWTVKIPVNKVNTMQLDAYEFGVGQKVKTGAGTTQAIQNVNAAQVDQDANITNAVTVGGPTPEERGRANAAAIRGGGN